MVAMWPCYCYQYDERCWQCEDKARRARDSSLCSVCHMVRPMAGRVCFGCSLGKARAQSPSRKKRGWLWPLL